jgi:hypothetical protein
MHCHFNKLLRIEIVLQCDEIYALSVNTKLKFLIGKTSW